MRKLIRINEGMILRTSVALAISWEWRGCQALGRRVRGNEFRGRIRHEDCASPRSRIWTRGGRRRNEAKANRYHRTLRQD
jgi:hypothetical protein